ncbi:Ni,Fe-hydrogenase III large subunit [Saccharomonospora marina XMU15]|uniref:Ni,Fe-hydrogenase III large subunit n=1 Tax=Saccharomonospora marina XMU15 TaxID=882083 RepID=H5X5S1_9PSEU|nr:NADH-quinone oxidoreductase subunit C [Saccharomonospora marina]EHR51219.1 Ni,Fe-hydrogenase III large subunit [Saccharomonospora marina XMU15]
MTTVDPIVAGQAVGHRRSALTVAADDLVDTANALLREGFRVALASGHDEGDVLRAVYLFTATGPDRRVELHVPLRRADPVVPSLATMSFPAGRFERELRDLYGIVPRNHPLPRRLVRHFHWPKGWYPMRADAGQAPRFGTADGPYPFRTVEGQGVYEIPVGPVHAGMIGPGHFRFSVVGETILNLKARLWFTHRGVEKLFEGRHAADGVELAERVSGDTSVGHTLAYCQAVEDALGLDVEPAALRVRAILLELERLYNHVADLGALCNDVGHGILNTHALRIREELLRLGDLTTGHRLLRGAVYPGGVDVAVLPEADRLAAVGADIAELVELALGHSVVRDRFTGTAALARQQAQDLGTLGYVARASGLILDARYDHPQFQPPLPRSAHSRTDGDVLARFLVRAEEAAASVELIHALLAEVAGYRGAPPDPARPLPAAAGSGVGIVEGWRGTIVHRVEFAHDATLSRVKIVDPSFFNWPALPVALADTIVPDFPLANKSFNLSYAGNDL